MTTTGTPGNNADLIKKLIIGGVAVFAFSMAAISYYEQPTTAGEAAPATPVNISKPAYTWEYRNQVNKMGDSTRLALLVANDLIEFDSPYNGGSEANLLLRKANNETDVILSVTKGHFIKTISGDSVRIRFDNDKAKYYSYSSPSDGSSDYIFIDSETDVIKRLKNSKKAVIECQFFKEGVRHIEFNTKSLNWSI